MKQKIISLTTLTKVKWWLRSKKSFVKTLNYIEHFLVLVSAVTRCTSTFTIASLVVIPIGVTSSAVALKFCAVTAAIKKYKSVIKNKKKEPWWKSIASKS